MIARLATPSISAATTTARPHRPERSMIHAAPCPARIASTPNAGKKSRTPSCPGVCGSARRARRKAQWPRTSSPNGSAFARRIARIDPTRASARNPTGVAIAVQMSVLYQGSDSTGVL